MLKWILIPLFLLALAIGIAWLVGSRLPISHTATSSREIQSDQESVYRRLSDFANYPSWLSSATRVEVTEIGEKPGYIMMGKDGTIAYEVTTLERPHTLATRIASDDLLFGGTWKISLETTSQGTSVRVTERGEVYNPLFRLLSTYVFGHTATMEQFLADLDQSMSQ